MKWKNTERINNCVKISGSRDRLMPPTSDKKTITIQNGTHFMIVDRATEISEIINLKIESIAL